MINVMDVPLKQSTLERRLDKLILLLFFILFTMCLIGAVGRFVGSPSSFVSSFETQKLN
jgi:hypothetical protein